MPMKTVSLLIAIGLALPALSNAASLPSAKATAEAKNIAVVGPISTIVPPDQLGDPAEDAQTTEWQNVLSRQIKVPNGKDLFIGTSLEIGLMTQTLVASKGGDKNTSTAAAGVEVRVVIDAGTANAKLAAPGKIKFNEREQQLTA